MPERIAENEGTLSEKRREGEFNTLRDDGNLRSSVALCRTMNPEVIRLVERLFW
jgi:hypothetical protein